MKPPPTRALAIATIALFSLVVAMCHADKLLAPAPSQQRFTEANKQNMQLIITANGFDCRSVIDMRDMLLGGGFVAHCAGSAPGTEYWFNVADEGGKWIVTVK